MKFKTFTFDITMTLRKWKPYCKADQCKVIPRKV